MKILFIHHLADVYGSSKSLLRLCGGLVADGHEVMVALKEDGPLREALNRAGARTELVVSIPVLHRNRLTSPARFASLVGDAFRCHRALSQLVAAYRPDLMHTNTGTILPIPGMVARSAGIPHIQHIRESFLGFGLLWPPYRTWLVRYADKIACISHFMASMFTAAQQASKTVVVHNGIPREEFDFIDRDAIASFRARYAGDVPLIGLIGRIKLVRKGQEVLVSAAALLKDRFSSARYVFVGSPFPGNESHLEELQGMVRAAGMEDRIHFVGHMDQPLIAIAALDISIMASSMPEPLGNVTIESMALGKPVIGTNIGGTPEIILDGETGLLVPPSDPEAMADALTRLLEHPDEAARMGAHGRERYLAAFEYRAFYRSINALYQSMTG